MEMSLHETLGQFKYHRFNVIHFVPQKPVWISDSYLAKIIKFSIFSFHFRSNTNMMKDTTMVWSRRKYLIIVILLWCRIIDQNIIGVNCNINRLHNILIRNSFPCAINSLCMCTNAGNGTHSYKISCHDVWFYKFTGESNSIEFSITNKQSIKFEMQITEKVFLN